LVNDLFFSEKELLKELEKVMSRPPGTAKKYRRESHLLASCMCFASLLQGGNMIGQVNYLAKAKGRFHPITWLTQSCDLFGVYHLAA
jgi:hypothetical protein